MLRVTRTEHRQRTCGVTRSPLASLTSMLYRAARLSATMRAASRGPGALGKRMIRRSVGRAWGRSGIPRWPK